MYGISNIGYVWRCGNCGFTAYGLNYLPDAYYRLERVINKLGSTPCSECGSRDRELRIMKKEQWEILKKKFPNKKAIYTFKTFGELAKLPDDCSSNPEV